MARRWHVVERFRGGGDAEVARVRLEDGRDALLKRFAPPAPPSFRAEVECLARVASPCVTAILDAGVDEDGSPWLLREFVEGAPLRRGPAGFDLQRLRPLLRDILSGLAAIHREGLVHGDLKPENVLVTRDGTARIADFGLAAATLAAPAAAGTAGSAYYVAPERLLGWPADARADLFAFGVLLHELAGGALPEDPARFYARFPRAPFLECVPRAPTDARALAIVRRCTSVDPLLRPASIDALVAELAAAGLLERTDDTGFLPHLPDDFFLRPLLREIEQRLDAGPPLRVLVPLGSESDVAPMARALALMSAVRAREFIGPGHLAELAAARPDAIVFAPATLAAAEALAPRLLANTPSGVVSFTFEESAAAAPFPGLEPLRSEPPDPRRLAAALFGSPDETAEAPLPLRRFAEELLRRAGARPRRMHALLAALAAAGCLRVRAGGVEPARLDLPWDALAARPTARPGCAGPVLRVARLLELAEEPVDDATFRALCESVGVAPLAARAELSRADALVAGPDGVALAVEALAPASDDERRSAARALLAIERAARRRPAQLLRLSLRAGELDAAVRIVMERREELGRAGTDRVAPLLEELLAAVEAPARGPAALLLAVGRLLLAAGRSARATEVLARVHDRTDATDDERLDALRRFGDASLQLARLDVAARAFGEGLRRARGTPRELSFVRGLADARLRAGDPAGALAAIATIAREPIGRPDPEQLQISGLQVLALLATDAVAEAGAVVARALGAARTLGDPAVVALLLTNLALVRRREGRLAAAIDATREALALQEERGQLHEVALLHQNLGVYLKEAVRGEEARHHLMTALELKRVLGDGRGVAVGAANLALLALERGVLKEAEARLATARPLMERHGQPRERLVLDLAERRLALRMGRWRGLSRALAELRDRAHDAGAHDLALDASLLRFERRLAAHDLEGAAEELTRAEREAAAARDGRSEPMLQLRRAQLRRALGTIDAARAQLAAVRGRVAGSWLECDEWLEEVATEGPPPPLELLEAAERAARVAQNRLALAEALLFRAEWHRARGDRHGAAASARTLEDVLTEVTGSDARTVRVRALLGATAARRAAHRRASPGGMEPEDEMAQNLELLRTFLAINRRLAHEADLGRLLEYLVDTALALSAGERGFLVLESEGRTVFEVSRSARGGAIGAPERELSTSFLAECLEKGRPLVTSNAGLDPRFRERASVSALELRSILCVPLRVDDATRAALYLDNPVREGVFGQREIDLVEALADQAGIALQNLAARRRIETMNAELARRVETRESELALAERDLDRAGRDAPAAGSWVGGSSAFVAATRLIDRFAATELTVLVTGESGTGKELAARRLHERSGRRDRPFVSENCSAIPETLLEAEFFGVRKGAFTGADQDRPGLFELARGGTLFLDEIGDLPLPLQAKLLRVLEERTVRPLGASAPVAVDFRLVAATLLDLREAVRSGEFREDLFFRIAVAEVRLPALREREGDVRPLVEFFLERRNAEHGTRRAFSDEALARMERHAWPGNVRELRNEVERTYAIAEGDILDWQAPAPGRAASGGLRWPDPLPTLQELERLALAEGLARTGGDKEAVARQLGISRASVYEKIRRYELRPDPGRRRPGS